MLNNLIYRFIIFQSLAISSFHGLSQLLALERVSDFTHYSLHFKESSRIVGRCHLDNLNNGTHQAFTKSIDRCSARNYSPRYLMTSQISWKSTQSESKDDASESINGSDSIGSKNATSNTTEKKKVEREIIHKYLAFALLLPQQPFSTDLLKSIISVGPMFPTVTIVSGSGYDFTELCRQYNVRSFPKLFFFKDGLLSGTYNGEYSAPEIASRLASWTQTLPKALPMPITRLPSHIFPEDKNLRYYFWAPGSILFSSKIFGYKVIIRVPFCTEPIISNSKELVPYDSLVFVLSGLFVLIRFIQYLYFFNSANVSVTQ